MTSVALHRFATGNTQTTAQAQQVWGLGKYVTEQENYGTAPDDVISVDGAPAPQLHGIRSVQTLDGAALIALKQAAIADFVKRMAVYPAYKQREKL